MLKSEGFRVFLLRVSSRPEPKAKGFRVFESEVAARSGSRPRDQSPKPEPHT